MFRTLGFECVEFLGKVIPAFLSVIRGAAPAKLDSYFNQLAVLVTIVKQHIREHLHYIVKLIQDFWHTSVQLQGTIIDLIEAIAKILEGDFKTYLAGLLPMMLSVLKNEDSVAYQPTEKILHALMVFGTSAEEYMHLILPAIVESFERGQQSISVRKSAILSLGTLSRRVNLNDYASKIIHPLTRILSGPDPALRHPAMETLCALIFQLNKEYLHFVPTVRKAMSTHHIQHQYYDLLVSKLRKGEPLPQNLSAEVQYDDHIVQISHGPDVNLTCNKQHLQAAWRGEGKSTHEDWQEWMRKLSATLLVESPNRALRSCQLLGTEHPALARELFNSAFVSCWNDLFDDQKVRTRYQKC
jgi:FKBP12-rapamycin complex-associated protein